VDNRSAITRVRGALDPRTQRRHLGHDADVIAHLTSHLGEMKLRYCTFWVKAHQDDKCPYKELDMLGRMNVDADALVESFRHRMETGVDPRSKERWLVCPLS